MKVQKDLLVPLKVKVKVIKEYYFVPLSFGPHIGDSKAIKEDHSISLLHTLALTGTTAHQKISQVLKKEDFMIVP